MMDEEERVIFNTLYEAVKELNEEFTAILPVIEYKDKTTYLTITSLSYGVNCWTIEYNGNHILDSSECNLMDESEESLKEKIMYRLKKQRESIKEQLEILDKLIDQTKGGIAHYHLGLNCDCGEDDYFQPNPFGRGSEEYLYQCHKCGTQFSF